VGALILAALYDLYDRLLAEPDSGIAKPAYSEGNVVMALEIYGNGGLRRAVPLGTQKGKNVVGLKIKVPERVKRAAGDDPNFLCDNIEYMVGVRPGATQPDERSSRRRELCQELHEKILGKVDDEGAKAVMAFLNRETDNLMHDSVLQTALDTLALGGNLVFRLVGDNKYVHDRPAVMRAWERYKSKVDPQATMGQCLITGEYGPIAVLHKSTQGVVGAQSTGGSLVSFNFKAAESYGKEQGGNSPVSERAAFAYGTALSWLTSNSRHRVLAGDTTIVFWAEKAGPEEDLMMEVFAGAFGMDDRDDKSSEASTGTVTTINDEQSAVDVKGILNRLFRGDMPANTSFDENVRFYVLGLAPNAARLSVRLWSVNTFVGLLKNVSKHFEDMAIVHGDRDRPVSIPRLLLELAPAAGRKRDAVPKVLVGSLMRSVLDGTAYPESLYVSLIARIRVDSNDPDQPRFERKVNYPRAAFIKAHLKRKARIVNQKDREEALTQVLNTENRNPGYLLGRLFALLEKAQQDANPGINATIKDRYYASASSTPGSVFPVLLRLVQHHLSKMEERFAWRTDKLIEGVLSDIAKFPTHLTLEQQGLFALGYYQQRSDLYKKADNTEKGGDDRVESN